MIKTFSVFSALCLISCSVWAQPYAHKTYIQGVQADGRGEVAVTMAEGGEAKIWSLKDGSLVLATEKGSAEWFTKQVRYKFYNYTMLATDQDRRFEREYSTATTDRYSIMQNRMPIGDLKFPKNSVESEDYSRATDRLLLRGISEGKARVWIFDPKISKTEAKLLDTWKVDADAYIMPHWSPSGQYIICPYSRNIWNISSGKKVNFDKDIKCAYSLPYAFTTAEDKVAVTTEDGMAVIDTKTGKKIIFYPIPAELKSTVKHRLTACSDGKSFIVSYEDYVEDRSINPQYKRAFLVTEGKLVKELLN